MTPISASRVADIMSARIYNLAPEDTVESAVRLMAAERVSCVLVLEEGLPVGILTERDVLRLLDSGTSREIPVAAVMSAPVVASDDLDFRAAYALLRQREVRHLVVTDRKGQAVGVISETDFRNHLGHNVFCRIQGLAANMDRDILRVAPQDSLSQVVRRMLDEGRDYTIVVADNKPVGIVTERDMPKIMNRQLDVGQTTVSAVMTAPVHTVSDTAPVTATVEAMMRRRLRHMVVVDAAGNVAGVVSQHRLLELLGIDLLEDALRHSEEQYRALVNTIREVVFQVDAAGRLTFLNPAWLEMTGLSIEQTIGRSLAGFTHADDAERQQALCDALVMGEAEEFEAEIRYRGKDGGFRWTVASGRPIRNAARSIVGVSGTLFDITEHKAAAGRLAQAAATAQTANIAKSRFLATMSHEVRTPLNGILGMAQLLQAPAVGTADRQEFAHTILESGWALAKLFDEILDLSAIEVGTLKLAPAVLQPKPVIEGIIAHFASTAHAKGLRIETSWYGPNGSCYLVDPIRLRQMISNLVANAVKFTERGFVRVEATQIRTEGNAALLEFAVADSGIGVPPDHWPRLFLPFSQADDSVSRKHGGAGLGLSVVAGLARLMNGETGFESQEGKGSRFWFRLWTPLAQDHRQLPHPMHGHDQTSTPSVH